MAKRKKRSRSTDGRYVGDDPKTPNINEAYERSNWKKWGIIVALLILFVVVILNS